MPEQPEIESMTQEEKLSFVKHVAELFGLTSPEH
jgi:hypothetical protein